MPDSDQKRHPLPLSSRKRTTDKHMPPSQKKMHPLPVNDTTIRASAQMHYKKQMRGKWYSFKEPKDLPVYTKLRTDVEEYLTQYFNKKLYKLQVKY